MPEEPRDKPVEQRGGALASLAHDIRGCLHALRMGRELLKQLYPEEKLIEVCDLMEREERRASELLEELLEAARCRD